MPKVQLIFILHVSTYRYVFPLRLLPCWYVSCPKSCVWARSQQLLSCRPGSVYPVLWKAVLTYQGHSSDPEDPIFKEQMFVQFWRQCLPSIVSCQSLFADGLFSCRKSPGVRCSEGAHRELPSAKGACLRTGFRFPGWAAPWHPHCRIAAFHLSFRQQDKLSFG